jgi:Farnesoic acid 0-methyl transferase
MRWLVVLVSLAACKVKDPPPITDRWTDDFERGGIGGDYYKTGPGYAIQDGALSAHGARNHPLWLRKKLTRDVRIEVDCWSNEPRGDIKVELFGDGKSFDAKGGRYTATGYELIFGGWYNAKSEIARLDEHGKDIAERSDVKVVPKRHYHWKIERVGQTVTWWIDDMAHPFLVWTDPHPLEGTSHEYFAINNWETDTWFDNLVVTPL